MNAIISDVLSKLPMNATKFERFLHIIKVLEPVSRPNLAEAAVSALDTTPANVFTMIQRATKEQLISRSGANKDVRFSLAEDALTRFQQTQTRPGFAPKTGTKVKLAAAAQSKPVYDPDDDLANEILTLLHGSTSGVGGWTASALAKAIHAEPLEIAAKLRELFMASRVHRERCKEGDAAWYVYQLPDPKPTKQPPAVKESLTAAEPAQSPTVTRTASAPVANEPPRQEPADAPPPSTTVALEIADPSQLQPGDRLSIDVSEALGPAQSANRCRRCGCTDTRACPGRCWWVEPDLCSSCAPIDPGSGFALDPGRVDLEDDLRVQLAALDDLMGDACDSMAPHSAIRCIHSASAALRHALDALNTPW